MTLADILSGLFEMGLSSGGKAGGVREEVEQGIAQVKLPAHILSAGGDGGEEFPVPLGGGFHRPNGRLDLRLAGGGQIAHGGG